MEINLLDIEYKTGGAVSIDFSDVDYDRISPDATEFKDGKYKFQVHLDWGEGENWLPNPATGIYELYKRKTEFISGSIISTQQFHYGTYQLHCKVPSFIGAWSAVWMYNLNRIPPEIDIMEVMCKPSWARRLTSWLDVPKVMTSLHTGVDYGETKVHRHKDFRMNLQDIDITMVWDQTGIMFWHGKNKDPYVIYEKDLPPMNIIMGMGLGTWGVVPDYRKFKPFIVDKFTYTTD